MTHLLCYLLIANIANEACVFQPNWRNVVLLISVRIDQIWCWYSRISSRRIINTAINSYEVEWYHAHNWHRNQALQYHPIDWWILAGLLIFGYYLFGARRPVTSETIDIGPATNQWWNIMRSRWYPIDVDQHSFTVSPPSKRFIHIATIDWRYTLLHFWKIK